MHNPAGPVEALPCPNLHLATDGPAVILKKATEQVQPRHFDDPQHLGSALERRCKAIVPWTVSFETQDCHSPKDSEVKIREEAISIALHPRLSQPPLSIPYKAVDNSIPPTES
jgi:hypothetical protein